MGLRIEILMSLVQEIVNSVHSLAFQQLMELVIAQFKIQGKQRLGGTPNMVNPSPHSGGMKIIRSEVKKND